MREFTSVVQMPGIRHALMCLVGQIAVKSTSVIAQCKRKNQNARDNYSETGSRRSGVSRSVAGAWVRAIHLVATNFQCPRFLLEACMFPRHTVISRPFHNSYRCFFFFENVDEDVLAHKGSQRRVFLCRNRMFFQLLLCFKGSITMQTRVLTRLSSNCFVEICVHTFAVQLF